MAIVLNNVTTGYNVSTINSNFQKIEDYINDKLLARGITGVAGEAMMSRSLDMNGYSILNAYVDVNNAGSLLTVGAGDSRYYNITGDTLAGDMNVNGYRINNVPDAISSSQPVTLNQLNAEAAARAAGDASTLASSKNYTDGVFLGAASLKDIISVPSMSILRGMEPTSSYQQVYLRGYSSTSSAGGGLFFYDPALVKNDDDCVHIKTPSGKVWKRVGVGKEIKMEWAGALDTTQTVAAQDSAFANCLKAAASLSPTGYPQSIIKGLDTGVVYLASRHFIRCGTFPESLSWMLPATGGGMRFGIDGTFAIGQNAGFFVVQANNPLFKLRVDNTPIAFRTGNYTDSQIATLVDSNYILRLESMVNAPEFDLQIGNYPGTVLYSKGKTDYSDVTAQWPDLTTVLPSIQNIGKAAINIKTCGRDFYLNNCGAGFGHMHSVWTQNNSQPGQLNSLYDVTLTFEDYVPHTETRGGLIINACGTLSLENILIGAGGIGHLCVWDSRNVHINRHIAICGNTTWASSNQTDDLYALEICNSEVNISGAHAQNSGRFLRVGFNSQVTFNHLTGWDVSRLILMTNDLTKLKYRGQRQAELLDPSRVYINGGFLQNLNAQQFGWACAPVITIDSTIGGDFKFFMRNVWMNNIHAGYGAETEANLAIIDVQSTSSTGTVDIDSGTRLEGNITNYVIRLANKNQLGMIRTRQTDFCRVRYTDDNSQSSFAMRESSHPNGTTAIPIDGSTYSYAYRRPAKYFVSLTIPAGGGSCSVNKNGFPVFQTTVVGVHNINLEMKYQETFVFTQTNATVSNAQWRFTLEE